MRGWRPDAGQGGAVSVVAVIGVFTAAVAVGIILVMVAAVPTEEAVGGLRSRGGKDLCRQPLPRRGSTKLGTMVAGVAANTAVVGIVVTVVAVAVVMAAAVVVVCAVAVIYSGAG